MTELQAIKDSIKHWKVMRKWVKKQNKTELINKKQNKAGLIKMSKMEFKIQTNWQAEHCTLCDLYYNIKCIECPLRKKYGRCGQYKNAWYAVSYSETWSEWYKHSTLMLKQLKSLLPKGRQNADQRGTK